MFPKKRMLHITEPDMNPEGPLDVIIKKEAIDVDMETVVRPRITRVYINKKRVVADYENAIPESRILQKTEGLKTTVKQEVPETKGNEGPTVQIVHDPIPFVQRTKEMLEITVPSMNTHCMGVKVKEEPIDIHTETVEVSVQGDSNRLQDCIPIKQEVPVCVSSELDSEHSDGRTRRSAKPTKSNAERQQALRGCQRIEKNENKQESTRKPAKTNAERQKAYRERLKIKKAEIKRDRIKLKLQDAQNVTDESPEEVEKRKELKRKVHRERQKAYYYRQKEKRGKKVKLKTPKSKAECQRTYRQRKREKMRRQKMDNNVVQCRAVEVGNVTLQEKQFNSQLLRIYEQRNECITPKVTLHRNIGVPSDGNCLFHSLINVLQLQIEISELKILLRDSIYLNFCHNPKEAYRILSSANDYGDLDCLYIFSKNYHQNVCVHYCFYNVTTKSEDTIFCHFKENGTQNWIHLHLREQHFTPLYEVSEVETIQEAIRNEARDDANIQLLNDCDETTEDNHNNESEEIGREDSIGEDKEIEKKDSIVENEEVDREDSSVENKEIDREDSIGVDIEIDREDSIGEDIEIDREDSIGENKEIDRGDSIIEDKEIDREDLIGENKEFHREDLIVVNKEIDREDLIVENKDNIVDGTIPVYTNYLKHSTSHVDFHKDFINNSNSHSCIVSDMSTSKPENILRTILQFPKDKTNYMRYHIMGSVPNIRMKPGCVPRFECQSKSKNGTRNTKKNNGWEKRDGNERTEDLYGIATDESETPTNIIHDPIPFIQSPKDSLEITVPSVNRDAVGVIIKEEAIDIHEETVEERAADVRVKIERIEDSDSDVIPDTSRTQVSEERKVSAKQTVSEIVNAEQIPQTIYDPTPKETLEMIVPNMNPEGPVGVTMKEELIDMYGEAGETRHTTDIVKIEEHD